MPCVVMYFADVLEGGNSHLSLVTRCDILHQPDKMMISGTTMHEVKLFIWDNVLTMTSFISLFNRSLS
jgi:hypothetical protein